jgi:hypothetical protein
MTPDQRQARLCGSVRCWTCGVLGKLSTAIVNRRPSIRISPQRQPPRGGTGSPARTFSRNLGGYFNDSVGRHARLSIFHDNCGSCRIDRHRIVCADHGSSVSDQRVALRSLPSARTRDADAGSRSSSRSPAAPLSPPHRLVRQVDCVRERLPLGRFLFCLQASSRPRHGTLALGGRSPHAKSPRRVTDAGSKC